MDHSTTTLILSLVLGVVAVADGGSPLFEERSIDGFFVQRVTTERRPRVIITPTDMESDETPSKNVTLSEVRISNVTSIEINDTASDDDLSVNDSRLLAALATLAYNVQREQEISSISPTNPFITDTTDTSISPDCNGSDLCLPSSSFFTTLISSSSGSSSSFGDQTITSDPNVQITKTLEPNSETPRLKNDDNISRTPWQEAYERWLQRYTETLTAYENTYGFPPPAELPQAFHRVPDLTLAGITSKRENISSHGEGFRTEFYYNVRGPGSRPGGSLVRLVNGSSQPLFPSVLWSEPEAFGNSVDEQIKPTTDSSTDDEEDSEGFWFNLSPDTSIQTSSLSSTTQVTESHEKSFTYTPAWIKDLMTTESPEIGRSNAGKRKPVLVLTAPKCTRPGQDLSLACLLKRTPDLLTKNLTLTWKKIDYIGGTARPLLLSENSSLKVVDYRLSLEKAPDMTRLRLWNVSYQDTGIYQCEASTGETAYQSEVTVRMCE